MIVKWNGLPKKEQTRLIIMSIFHKILIGLSLMLAFVLVALLHSKKISMDVKRNGLLLEIIGNVSHGLDKLDSGLDAITSKTKVAKGRLRQLVALHRESIIACAAMLRNRHSERSPTPEKPQNEPLVHSDYQDKQMKRTT